MQTDRPVTETQFEAMAERYRQELLRMQRATAPGRTARELIRPIPRSAEPDAPTEEATGEPATPSAQSGAGEAPVPPPAQEPPERKPDLPEEPRETPPAEAQGDFTAAEEPPEQSGSFAPKAAHAPEKEPPPAPKERKPAGKGAAPKWEPQIMPGAARAPAKEPPPALPDTGLLPLVQSAVEDAARQALHEPWQGETVAFPPFARVCGGAGVFTPGEAYAALLPGEASPRGVRMRFSAMLPEGAPDAARCQRSAALLIQDGPCIPFLLTDADFSADPAVRGRFAASVEPEKETGLRSPERFWREVLAAPESLAAVRELYSDRGTPPSWRSVAFASPPLLWETKQGQRVVRCRLAPREHAPDLTARQAEALGAADGDALARDLWLALQSGEEAVWELSAQTAEPDGALCDPARRWDEKAPAKILLGEVALTHNAAPWVVREWKCEAVVPVCRAAARAPAFDGMAEEEAQTVAKNLSAELLRLPEELSARLLALLAQENPAFARALEASLDG